MRQGFTLIELAIAIVVVGIIIGGVLTGSDLLRQSEVKSLVTEVRAYQTAYLGFKQRYNALPGDMDNATDYWGVADATPADCYTKETEQGTETCNGDGDGLIYTVDSGTTYSEFFRAWQHLANAELLPGHYTGASASGGSLDHEPGTNAPANSIGGGCMFWIDYRNDTHTFSTLRGRQAFWCGNDGGLNNSLSAPTLTPSEAYLLDKKIDDGKPSTGKVFGVPDGSIYTADCTTTNNVVTSEYDMTQTDKECPFIMLVE